jgi:signal transduction histidine kinase
MAQARTGGEVTMAGHELPGGPPHLAANVAPIRDEAGERLGIVTVLQDITELKSLQQAMSDFVSMVAHELRSPLGAISQYLDVLKAGIVKDTEKERYIITRCRERTGALSQLVKDLLDFSVMQRRGQTERSVVPLNVAEVIRETAEFLTPQAAEKSVSVSVDLPEELWIEADRAEMGRLFTNLLTNAIKYNREGGSVRFSAHPTDGYVGINVTDTGLGIAPAALARLGEAFYRVKTPQTTQVTGTGLGLSICKQIIAAHDGHLEIESEEGRGSTFQVLLPRRRAVG